MMVKHLKSEREMKKLIKYLLNMSTGHVSEVRQPPKQVIVVMTEEFAGKCHTSQLLNIESKYLPRLNSPTTGLTLWKI